MYQARIEGKSSVCKPKVVIDKRFSFLRKLEVGEKGQLDAMLRVEGVGLEMDADGNERLHFDLIIENAQLIDMAKKQL